MRFIDIMGESEENTQGTYLAASFDQATKDSISRYCEIANVPNPVPGDSLHCTIVYSRTAIDIHPNFDCSFESVSVSGLELWPVKNGKNVLVLTLTSPYLHSRFNEAIGMGATYDYDEYKPHMTLSYDAGDFDIDEAPPLMFDIGFDCEYVEELVV